MAEEDWRPDPEDPSWVHLCVDMQRLFWPGTDWGLDWMPRVAPRIARFAARFPEHTIFTRFIPLDRPGDGRGAWKEYYERWSDMTLERLAPGMVELIPELAALVPPAEVVDKRVYSPWLGGDLETRLAARGCATLLVTGGETDMCVLATVLGAVDRGYRVRLAGDALCSSSDAAHDATLSLFSERFARHVEVVELGRL